MQAHDLRPPRGAKHARKRTGRGNASGHGTYSGKGLKGQKARSGSSPRRFFEGGQTRLFKALPMRRGFTNRSRKEFSPVNLEALNRFDEGTEVTPEQLKERGVISTLRRPVKVLGGGEIKKALTVRADRFSLSAREKIEAAGGSVIEMDPLEERQARAEAKTARRAVRATKRAAKPKAEAPAAEAAPKGKMKGPEAKDATADATAEAEAEAVAEETDIGDGD